MKPIRFTAHAVDKLAIMRRQGFIVDQVSIENAIRFPQSLSIGYSGRLIAQAALDQRHVLRVIYEESEEITVVTVYPARRQRYES